MCGGWRDTCVMCGGVCAHECDVCSLSCAAEGKWNLNLCVLIIDVFDATHTHTLPSATAAESGPSRAASLAAHQERRRAAEVLRIGDRLQRGASASRSAVGGGRAHGRAAPLADDGVPKTSDDAHLIAEIRADARGKLVQVDRDCTAGAEVSRLDRSSVTYGPRPPHASDRSRLARSSHS